MKKLKTFIFIDAANFHYFLQKAGWKIDWEKFRAYFKKKYGDASFYYYEGVPSKSQYFDIYPDKKIFDFSEVKNKKLEYFKFLKNKGYTVRHKPVGRIYDNTEGVFKHKCNFDVELTIDALDNIDKYDVSILCSGDGDFVKLIKYLKGKKKKTIVLAAWDRLSNKLEEAANQVIYLEDIKDHIFFKED